MTSSNLEAKSKYHVAFLIGGFRQRKAKKVQTTKKTSLPCLGDHSFFFVIADALSTGFIQSPSPR